MHAQPAKCIACGQSKEEIPLLALVYKEEQYWICPQHLPLLIHHPDELIGKLPGADKLVPHTH